MTCSCGSQNVWRISSQYYPHRYQVLLPSWALMGVAIWEYQSQAYLLWKKKAKLIFVFFFVFFFFSNPLKKSQNKKQGWRFSLLKNFMLVMYQLVIYNNMMLYKIYQYVKQKMIDQSRESIYILDVWLVRN